MGLVLNVGVSHEKQWTLELISAPEGSAVERIILPLLRLRRIATARSEGDVTDCRVVCGDGRRFEAGSLRGLTIPGSRERRGSQDSAAWCRVL